MLRQTLAPGRLPDVLSDPDGRYRMAVLATLLTVEGQQQIAPDGQLLPADREAIVAAGDPGPSRDSIPWIIPSSSPISVFMGDVPRLIQDWLQRLP